MGKTTWLTGDGNTLAEYIPQDLFKGLLERRLAIPPDRVGILIRDGQIVDSYVGGHFSVGGLWTRLKEAIAGPHALRMLVADLKPFQIEITLKGKTADHVPVTATVHAELQLDPERPENILGLVSDETILARSDIAHRFRPPIQTRVFDRALTNHKSVELRGNVGLQDQIQADTMRVVEEQAADLGLLVRSTNVIWAWTPVEQQEMSQRLATLQDEQRDFETQRELRELERKKTGTIWTLRTRADIERVQAAETHDLELMLAHQEIELADVRDTAERLNEFQKLKHRIRMEAEARQSALQAALETEENELVRIRIRQQIALEEGRTRQLLKQMELETRRLEQQLEQEQGNWAVENQLRKLQGLDQLEANKTARETEHAIRLETARKEMELRMLELKATMTPEQLLALQAGDSPQVAAVFAKQMEVQGINQAEKEQLLREIIETERSARRDQAEQARHMFDQSTDRLAEVGRAAAIGRADPPSTPLHAPAATVRCPECGASVPRGKHCSECGAALPT